MYMLRAARRDCADTLPFETAPEPRALSSASAGAVSVREASDVLTLDRQYSFEIVAMKTGDEELFVPDELRRPLPAISVEGYLRDRIDGLTQAYRRGRRSAQGKLVVMLKRRAV